MKKLVLPICFIAIFATNSTPVLAYVPDLFGAYQRGVEMAQQQNAQDAYYYAQMQPRMYVEVYEQGKKKPKRNMKVSLKKGDNLCWQLYPLSNGNQYSTAELFTLPQAVAMGTPFFGQSPSTNNPIHNAVQLSNQTYGFNRRIISTGNSIGACWVFNPTATLKGVYYIQIGVGQRDFDNVAFEIVD